MKMLSKKICTLLVSLPLLITSNLWAAPVKIMPLGDSITSDGGDSAYRNELFDSLTSAGYDFEYVGSLTDNDATSSKDTKHEGHSGWEANDIINHQPDNLSTWVTGYDVDIALIHLGTNDIINRAPNDQANDDDKLTRTELEGIISIIKNKNSNASIFVAKVLPLGSIKDVNGNYIPNPPNLANDYSAPLNSLLDDTWAASQSITLVDQYTGFIVEYMKDGMIHPNADGELEMAKRWFSELTANPIIPPKLTLNTPLTTAGSTFNVSISPASLSAGAISYTSYTTNICTVDPTTGAVTPSTLGICEISASQKEDINSSNKYAATTSAPVSIAIGLPQVISFNVPLPATKTYGDAIFPITATADSGLPVSIEPSLTPAICTINAGNVTIIKAGDCKLKATQSGGTKNGIIYAAASSENTIIINKAEQTINITVAPPLNKTFGDAPFEVTATSFDTKTPPVATGLIVDIGTTTTNVCTYDAVTKKVTIKSAGLCTIKAVQQGNDNYKDKTEAFDVSISAKGQTIAFPTIPDKAVNDVPFTISATASSNLPVSFSSTTTNVCTVSNKTVTLVAIGTCRITATAGNTNNTTASATQEFEVTKVLQTVTFANNTPTAKTTKNTPFTVSASSTSNLDVSIVSTTKNICTVDANNKVSIHAAGNCILEAQQAGNATYATANAVHTIVVSVANTAYDQVVKIINGSSNATTTNAQLKKIGLKKLNPNYDYTQALKKGSYKNKAKPTTKELQKVIDDENKGGIETAGSVSLLWLTLLGFIGINRRKFLKN